MDEDGFIYVSGRKKDVIISGGLNICAADLETELLKHEAVADAVIIGIPRGDWGKSPLASPLFILNDGCRQLEKAILAIYHIKSHIRSGY